MNYFDCDQCIHKAVCPAYMVTQTECEHYLSEKSVAPVRHGVWLGQTGLFQGKCSVCGWRTFEKTADWARAYWKYCPKCGALLNEGLDNA